MKLGIVYSGERLEPRSFRGLQQVAVLTGDIEITQLIDASSADEDRGRVENFASFLRLAPERQAYPDFQSVDALIIEVGSNPREPFQIGSLISQAVEAGVHLHLPYNALTALPYDAVVDLFELAEARGVRIVACTRFLFGQAYTQFRQKINTIEFGHVRDANCRIAIGPVERDQLLEFALHHLNIIFDLFPEKPVGITVMASSDPAFQPCIHFALRFKNGEISSHFLTANRLWGSVYHSIEVSGNNAYAWTDLGIFRYRTGMDANTQVSDGLNDDDQGHVIYGSSGKLKYFTSVESEDVSAIAHFSKITKRSLWVYRILQDILTNDSIATRSLSCTDTADGWK